MLAHRVKGYKQSRQRGLEDWRAVICQAEVAAVKISTAYKQGTITEH